MCNIPLFRNNTVILLKEDMAAAAASYLREFQAFLMGELQ